MIEGSKSCVLFEGIAGYADESVISQGFLPRIRYVGLGVIDVRIGLPLWPELCEI